MSKISLDKSKIKFLLLEGVHQSAIDTLNAQGYTNIEYLKTALNEDELIEKMHDVHFVGIRSRTKLTRRVFENAPKLIAAGCFCIGTNQVDLQAAQEHGVVVFNAPYSNTRSVAELVIGEAILMLRKIPQKNFICHRGGWEKAAEGCYESRGKTLGLVGYGSIGSQTSVLAEALGMKVKFYDVITKLPLGNANQVRDLDELLAESDIISLHVPETAATKNMFGAREFGLMKKGALFINASRGTVVDIDALAEAIKSGHLAGAAIDVFPEEPKANGEEFLSPLRGLDNVILTPHIGGSTMEAQANIGIEVAEKLAKYSDNGTTTSSVNFPEVALPEHPDAYRLLHVHANVPGVMSAINKIFSDNHLNITSQYLRTNDKVGYVVVDISGKFDDAALEQLKAIPGTIRCRVLF